MTAAVLAYPLGVGGLVSRVLECGEGGRTVVMVHGLGARADRWRQNLPAVAQAGWRAVALDLPGHGFAEKRASFPHGAPGYAAFLLEALDALEIERAVIVGTSLGGHVAATLACDHPRRIAGLMLIGATGLFPLGEEARMRLAQRAKDRSRAGIESKMRAVFKDPVHVTPAFVAEETRVNNSPGADEVFEALSRYFAEQLDRDVVGPRLAALSPRPPLELVWGADDRSVPLAVGREAEKLLAPVRLHVIEGCAHAPYFEQPGEFNRHLVSFLGSCP
jgi:2-hydroxy-6-oxonona-2,4-dienedioate hydrolase